MEMLLPSKLSSVYTEIFQAAHILWTLQTFDKVSDFFPHGSYLDVLTNGLVQVRYVKAFIPKLRIWSHLLKKSLVENFGFFAVKALSIWGTKAGFLHEIRW